jgi:sulfur-oxidizing protein SoxB
MTLARTGAAIDPDRTYAVAGWASINEGTEGPPIYDLVANWIEKKKVVNLPDRRNVKVTGADPRGIAP